MRALILILSMVFATPSAAQVPCPNPSGGFSFTLNGDPRFMIYDSMQQQESFLWNSGLLNTFINVDQTVAQQCGQTRDSSLCWGAVFGTYQQLVLTRQWNCPITLTSGQLWQSVIP
jgi:hypothetical protein